MNNKESILISDFVNSLNENQLKNLSQIIKLTNSNECMNLKILLEILKRRIDFK